MNAPVTSPPGVDFLLEQSAASAVFAAAVRELAAGGRPGGQAIMANSGAPPVKVLRTICQLLEQYPGEEIRSVKIEGRSGCSDFRGTMEVHGGRDFRVEFVWNCAWKARQVGYKDFFGDPDQSRAAREFGYRCFEHFREVR